MRERFMAYITTDALTDGIRRIKVVKMAYPNMVADAEKDNNFCYRKGEWHRSLMEAKISAEEMRKAEIERLRSEIRRLEELRF